MNKRLKLTIEKHNKVKFKRLPFLSYNSKRIIIATLKPDKGTVTTAPIYKE